jgi:serine protease
VRPFRAVPRPLVATPIALALAAGVFTALPSLAAAEHTDQGTATLPSPVGFGATDLAFTTSCPDPGPTQGLDGWVFALPAGLAGGTATITGSGDADVAAYVYDDACTYLRSETDTTTALELTLGATDRYLSVYATDAPQVTFDLSVTEGVTPEPTATATATPTATPTPSATPDTGTLRGRHTYPATPNDPFFAEAPLIAGAVSTLGQWGMQKVQAPQAWQEARATGAGVQVAVLDSGLDLGHPDLACEGKIRIAPGATPDGSLPVDLDGHGTHVAGIVGACTNNGTGVVGVAPDATILPFRVLGAEGGTAADLANAIRAAADAGAHVMNMSLGFGAGAAGVAVPGSGSAVALIGAYEADIAPAIEYAVSKGVVVVAAAGNETFPLCGYPALEDGVVCVGSTDRRDLPSYFSNFALKADGGVPTEGAALVAPGGSGPVFCDQADEAILSTYARDLATCDSTGEPGYQAINGTSMATPFVVGAAALVYDRLGAVRSPENAARVIQALSDSAVDLGVPGFDPQFGSGRLDVLGAVQAVDAVVDPEPTTTPTATPTAEPAKATALALAAGGTVQRTDGLPVAVSLVDAAGDPVAGASVDLTLAAGDVLRTTTVTTDAAGRASAALPVDLEPGTVELSATYAGSATTTPSGAHQAVDVLREDTVTAVTVSGKDVVTATLADADTASNRVAGVTVVLVDDKGGETPATTDAQGQATWAPQGAAKSKTYEVRFAGDARWAPSSATS